MKKRIIALLLGVLGLAAFADTAIPAGKAVYDVTLNITDYPELYEGGDWPVQIDLLLGQSFVGERVAVSTNIVDNVTNISLTVRAVWDIQKMIDYSTSDDYLNLGNWQAKIYTRSRLIDVNNETKDGGYWTRINAKMSFTGVTTVEGFANVFASGFLDTESRRTMVKPSSRSETGTPVMLNSISMALVRTVDETVCTAGTPVICQLRVRFNRPLSTAGYESISSLRVANVPSKATVFDYTITNPCLSSDGCELAGLVNADVGAILDLVNGSSYSTDASYKGMTTIYLNGSEISKGSSEWLAKTDGTLVTDLSETVKKSIIYRSKDSSLPCRVVAFELERKTAKDGGHFLMRW